MKVLAIAGSYRQGGITDQAVAVAAAAARQAGNEVEIVQLRDYPLEFCRNCRECMQAPGRAPGQCVLHDGLPALIERIEAADRFILASPTNFYTVTAVFKRFMERLVVYAYWPWGAQGPKFRKATATKKALVITSFAAPASIGRVFYATIRLLKSAAAAIGAVPVAVSIGLAARTPEAKLGAGDIRRIERAMRKIL